MLSRYAFTLSDAVARGETPATAQPSRAGQRHRRTSPYIGFTLQCFSGPVLRPVILGGHAGRSHKAQPAHIYERAAEVPEGADPDGLRGLARLRTAGASQKRRGRHLRAERAADQLLLREVARGQHDKVGRNRRSVDQ